TSARRLPPLSSASCICTFGGKGRPSGPAFRTDARATPIVVDTRPARWDPRCRGHPIKEDPVLKLHDMWRRWRESRRQYQLERAVFKASGGMEQFEHHRDGDLSQIKGTPPPPTPGTGVGTGGL